MFEHDCGGRGSLYRGQDIGIDVHGAGALHKGARAMEVPVWGCRAVGSLYRMVGLGVPVRGGAGW